MVFFLDHISPVIYTVSAQTKENIIHFRLVNSFTTSLTLHRKYFQPIDSLYTSIADVNFISPWFSCKRLMTENTRRKVKKSLFRLIFLFINTMFKDTITIELNIFAFILSYMWAFFKLRIRRCSCITCKWLSD